MDNVKVGIIGVGNIGFGHAHSLYSGAIDGFTLAALCDINTDLKKSFDEKFPGVPYYSDANEMLEKADIEAVIVAVPHPLHGVMGIKAFEHGKHVLVEKPIDISLSRGTALCNAARKSGKKFAVMFNQRTNKLFKMAREIVQGGQLGELKRSVWIITNWYRTQKYYDSGTWRATWAGEGGGVLVNQAPHQFDMWQWICGMPVQVTGFCDIAKYHDIEVEDNATLHVRFKNGAEGVFITTTGEFPGTNRLEITGSLGKLVLEGGVLKWWKLKADDRDIIKTATTSEGYVEHEYIEIPDEPAKNQHRMVIQNFADAIRFDTPLVAPGYEGINALTIQNAAYLSQWKGSIPIDLPFDTDEYDRLLEERKKTSKYVPAHMMPEQKTEYRDRWQVNW